MSLAVISLVAVAGALITGNGEHDVYNRKVQDVSMERSAYAECKKILSERNPFLPGVFLLHDKPALCIYGDINGSLVSEVSSAIKSQHGAGGNINYVVLSSDGGDLSASLKIAEMIEATGATVVVGDRCMSACSQFLFVAGAKKVILSEGLVLFHGGPISDETISKMNIPDEGKKSLLSGQEKFREFYRKRNIDMAMLTNPPPEVQKDWNEGRLVMWSWSGEQLVKFGVHDVYQELPLNSHI
jgi:hypothetical protein